MTPTGLKIRAKLAITLVFAMLLSVVSFAASQSSVAAHSQDTMYVSGHGWGHGRGMGQYGALGYAQQGWSSTQILNHYYSNTVSGQVPNNASVDKNAVRVNLQYMANLSTTVDLGSGSLVLKNSAGSTIQTITGQAVRLTKNGSGYDLYTGSACGASFTKVSTLNHSVVQVHASSSASDRDGLLEVCSNSQSVWVEGFVQTATSSSGYQRTVNVVNAEQYLRGVVPNESPAYWDMAALEAQSVAARSYLMAGDTRFQPYADTCDTAQCQVYDGVYTTRGGYLRAATQSRTNTAIENTTGIVRLHSNGSIARTEFSSSTGGHTVQGEFPAVVDAGDSVSSNPNHDWETEVDLAELDDYGRGRAITVRVVERNGLGEDGGRATKVEYVFPSSTITVTGNQTRLDFGLKSDWFSFADNPEFEESDEDKYVRQSFATFLGQQPTDSQMNTWRAKLEASGKKAVALELAKSDHFSGSLINEIYVSALGRASDAKGRAYWLSQMNSGVAFEEIGIYFYGSAEYYKISGSTPEKFVDNLYRDLLLRESDAKGRAYWVGQMRSGTLDQSGVVEFFYESAESQYTRAQLLYKAVMGEKATSAKAWTYSKRLDSVGDVELAAEMASAEAGFIS